MKFAWLLLILFALSSCENGDVSKKEKSGEPDIYEVESDDVEMNAAIENARQSLSQFDSALTDSKSDPHSFALKVKFPTESGTEHIWATDIVKIKGDYYGIVDNIPNAVKQIRLGEKIIIDRNRITDWMYAVNSELKGGYTIRYLRSRMTKDEREQFDSTFEFKIQD